MRKFFSSGQMILWGACFSWSLLLMTLLFFATSRTKINPEDSKALHILCWGDYFNSDTFTRFEEESGIKIYFHSYASTAELISKIRSTGIEDYDLVFTSDDAMRILVAEGYLAPMPKDLNLPPITHIMDIPYDPEGKYTLAYSWEAMGIATVGKNSLITADNAMDELFHPTKIRRLGMTSDPVEAISLAALYLYGEKESLTPAENNRVAALLIDQKKQTAAYSDHRAMSLLANGSTELTTLRSSYYIQMLLEGHADNLNYVIPKQGTFISIESVALTRSTQAHTKIRAFLEFIYRPEIMALQLDCCPLFASVAETYNHLPQGDKIAESAHAHLACPHKYLFKHLTSQEECTSTWIKIKGA